MNKRVLKKNITKKISSKKKVKKAKHSDIRAKGLNAHQELFCQYFASDREFFGNGVQSYVEAYDVDVTQKGSYDAARVNASKLLTNANILKRIDEIMEHATLNDQFVDKQLAFVIAQSNDLTNKVAAMKEYNKLKQRIVDKVDMTSKGERVKGITIVKHSK